MAHEQLERASDTLHSAADLATGDAAERLTTQANQFEELAETGADHGRLARHENALREIKSSASDEVVEKIDEAMSAITAYRETIEGV